MTTTTVADVTRSPRARARTRPTVAGLLLEELRELHAYTTGIRWPNPKYRQDPKLFAEEILGVEPWERQVEILYAVRDHDRVSVASGHKIGKSNTAGIVGYWFFTGFYDARVVLSSVTARQVDEILWREVRKMRARAGICLSCKRLEETRTPEEKRKSPLKKPCPHSALIDGKIGDLARTGLRADDLREIVGFTAREAEAVAGVSGENILYEIDEASGVEDAIFTAIEGNRAGGAKIVLFGNPTRSEGEFFESHHDKKLRVDTSGRTVGFYKCIRVSSEETPNVRLGRKVIPGLATLEWIEEKKAEWGEDSALYKIRVKGEFVLNEEGKILSVHAITLSEQRWEDTAAVGRLHIGIDPAGPGFAGDESTFAMRRGLKLLDLHVRRGLAEDGHVVELVGLLERHREHREPPPIVTIDREGPIGSRIYGLLRAYLETHPSAFILIGVRSSDKALRRPDIYDRVRDELWARLAEWFREGGAIPEDTRLARELHAPAWEGQLNGKLKATAKSDLRKLLDGRSPDRADSLALAVWEPPQYALAGVHAAGDTPTVAAVPVLEEPVARGIDPYGGMDAWRTR